MKKVFLGWKQEPFLNYINALQAIGAEVERNDPDRCDALLLPGGFDLHPRFYGQPISGAEDIDEARDEEELALFRRFLTWERPVFGICRGMQLINIALGGTLHQHIDGHSKLGEVDRLHGSHTDDAVLCSLYGNEFVVNSAHHQSIDRLGNDLRAVQWADDGTIEAIRHEALPIFAVQWHPERMCGDYLRDDAVNGAALLEHFLKKL